MSSKATIAMIWAQSANGIIGADGDMPWFVPEDFSHFKQKTIGAPVIMGRATWESLPEKNRPLPGRTNVVLSRNEDYVAAGAIVVSSASDALIQAERSLEANESSVIWVIGGGSVYSLFMDQAQILEVTDINWSVEGDTPAPQIPKDFEVSSRTPEAGWLTSRTGVEYAFINYVRKGDAAKS